tara:strand:- start:930 stop:1250 length:321 start_codon:yes stop_codon:yes gene_type:complete
MVNRKKRENRRRKNNVNHLGHGVSRNRTKEERQVEATKIIQSLQSLNLNPGQYQPVRTLYTLLQEYINLGERIEVSIPFPEIHKKIVGILAIRITESVVVKLTKEY